MSQAVYTTINEMLAAKPHKRDWTENLTGYFRFLAHRPGEWVALQALDTKLHKNGKEYLRPGNYTAFVDSAEVAAQLCRESEEKQAPMGVYLLHNRLDQTRPEGEERRRWVVCEKGESLKDEDFVARRAVYIDLDPERRGGISSTKAEANLAIRKASSVWSKLIELLTAILPEGTSPASSLAFGFSGNGCQIHVALDDLPATDETRDLTKSFLEALHVAFTDASVKVDRKVFDAKRLAPAFGTTKRKGADDKASGREHRRSWFLSAAETPYRLTLAEFRQLVDAVEALAPETEEKGDATEDVGMDGPAPVHKGAPRSSTVSKDDGFEAARAVPLRDVAQWLGLVEGDAIRCPGCGSTDGAGVHSANPRLYHCFHDRCAARPNKTTLDMVMAVKGLTGKDGLKQAYKLMADQFGLPALRGPGRPRKGEGAAPPPPPGSTGAEWENSLTRLNNGAIASTEANAVTVLLNTGWSEILRLNERTKKIEFAAPPGWHPDDAPQSKQNAGDAITDQDFDRVRLWLQRNWGLSLGKDAGVVVTRVVAEKKFHNTLVSYLDGLKWDGTPRIPNWLHSYAGAEKSEYNDRVGRWWLIQAVARAFKPGCKADYVLILEGLQGRKKSTLFEVLAGEEHFSDTPIEIGDKDSYLRMLGPWIMELSELDSLSRSEAKAQKAFFASRKDSFRAPYERSIVDVPRQVVFCGTVNDAEYLKDPSGGRRYWPVKVDRADIDAIRRDRDQLWAEAVHAYRAGTRYWPEGDEDDLLCEVEQEERRVIDPWQPTVAEHIADRDQVTIPEILGDALEIEAADRKTSDATRIGLILQALHWSVGGRLKDKGRTRFYARTSKADPKMRSAPVDDGSLIDLMSV